MISRVYKIEDLGWSERVAKCYAAETGRTYNRAHVENLWGALLKNELGAMWKYELHDQLAGVCGGALYPHPLSGERAANLLFWYVSPHARSSTAATDLADEFDLWAKGAGATLIQASVPVGNKRLASLHERRGMKILETIYQKEL